MDGESLTIIRSAGYIIHYIKPCTLEEGKKMAKIHLQDPPADLFERLEKGNFDELKCFPDLGVAKIRMGSKHVMVFTSGEISIRAADNEDDILQTAELLAKIIKSKNH